MYGHPDGPQCHAWFRVIHDYLAFPTAHHPSGATATQPWFVVVEPMVFRASGHPDGASPDASFEIIGSFLYLTQPESAAQYAPWYQIAPLP